MARDDYYMIVAKILAYLYKKFKYENCLLHNRTTKIQLIQVI